MYGNRCSPTPPHRRITTKAPHCLAGLALALLVALSALALALPAAAELPRDEFYITVVDPTIRNDRLGGFEPHILAGPSYDDSGEWYYYDSPSGLITGGVGPRIPGNLWISKDFGQTWVYYDKSTIAGTGGSGDSFTAINKDGVIYYTDLYLATASVDTSRDGGETWYANPAASAVGGQTGVGVDRQWLDIGPSQGGLGDETLYFSYNHLVEGLIMIKTDMLVPAAYDWVSCNAGLPITGDVRARDNFAVDENDGTIYIVNYAPGRGQLEVWVSTNGCDSFSGPFKVVDGSSTEIQNIFAIIDTDMAGNVYVTWSSRDQMHLAVSTDQAHTWATHTVTTSSSVKALPWVAAGDAGRVGLAWYESEPGDSGSPDEQSDSWWDLKAAITFDALNATPTFELYTVDPQIHYGGIQTTGTGGGSDRDLGDFLAVDIDSHGRLLISSGNDRDDGDVADSRMSYPMFASQRDGPFLREGTGPEVVADVTTDDRRARLDLAATHDREGLALTNLTVDWGDGSSPEAVDNASVPTHTYPDRRATYEITVQATNAIGMRSTLVLTVHIEPDDGWSLAAPPTAFVLLAVVAVAARRRRR